MAFGKTFSETVGLKTEVVKANLKRGFKNYALLVVSGLIFFGLLLPGKSQGKE